MYLLYLDESGGENDSADRFFVLGGVAVFERTTFHLTQSLDGLQVFGEEAVKRATEEICRRFDIFLMRRANEHSDPQRGLIVFAEGKYHLRGRTWVRDFRRLGTQWGVIKNLADIPYFASMPENRLLQAADLVAHAVFLAYERGDLTLVKPVLSRFDNKDGTVHGLVHVSDTKAGCQCAACVSRRTPGHYGTWS